MGKTILLIGRFQPFHKGHLFLARRCAAGGNRLRIAIGSPNRKDGRNPFPAARRKRMVSSALRASGIKKFSIFAVPDNPDDFAWLARLLRAAGKFDLAVSGNGWIVSIFRSAGLPIETHPFLRKRIYSGTGIRRLLSEKNPSWKERVPEEVAREIEGS